MWVFAFGCFFPGAAVAHDPYEITATASLQTNRLDLQVEMEFRTALRLAGVNREFPTNLSPEEIFTASLPQLRECAGRLLEITAAGSATVARTTNVTLVVENHVRFDLEFPPVTTLPLRFSAESLRALSEQGPYGVGLIVLDIVNKKVLGQPVLLASNPAAEVGDPAQTGATVTPDRPIVVAARELGAATGPTAKPVRPDSYGKALGVFVGAVALILLGALWLRTRGAKGKTQ